MALNYSSFLLEVLILIVAQDKGSNILSNFPDDASYYEMGFLHIWLKNMSSVNEGIHHVR